MVKLNRFAAASAILFLSILPSSSSIYAYTDAQGRIRITDIPDRDGQEIVLPRIRASHGPVVIAGNVGSRSSTSSPRTAYSAGTSARRYSAEDYRAQVRAAAQTHRLSESLIFAVMRAESNFNPRAVSRAGAQGLMQLIPSTARLVGVRDIFDPQQNINGGARYLRMMMDRFGRVDLALAAYNAGPEAVERHGGIPPYQETRNYVPRVMKYYREFGGSGELVLTSVKPLTPSRATTARTTSRPRTGSTPSVIARAASNPIFYFRGPDGQIYIYNR